jgi:hypothetical protein
LQVSEQSFEPVCHFAACLSVTHALSMRGEQGLKPEAARLVRQAKDLLEAALAVNCDAVVPSGAAADHPIGGERSSDRPTSVAAGMFSLFAYDVGFSLA